MRNRKQIKQVGKIVRKKIFKVDVQYERNKRIKKTTRQQNDEGITKKMISKIIQKEKKRQEAYLMSDLVSFKLRAATHKQSLINLKEYMEGMQTRFYNEPHHYNDIRDEIEELNKMIEKYG